MIPLRRQITHRWRCADVCWLVQTSSVKSWRVSSWLVTSFSFSCGRFSVLDCFWTWYTCISKVVELWWTKYIKANKLVCICVLVGGALCSIHRLGLLPIRTHILALATLAFCPTLDTGGETLAVPIRVHGRMVVVSIVQFRRLAQNNSLQIQARYLFLQFDFLHWQPLRCAWSPSFALNFGMNAFGFLLRVVTIAWLRMVSNSGVFSQLVQLQLWHICRDAKHSQYLWESE